MQTAIIGDKKRAGDTAGLFITRKTTTIARGLPRNSFFSKDKAGTMPCPQKKISTTAVFSGAILAKQFSNIVLSSPPDGKFLPLL
ncbi:MAG: hypothetical protein AB1461_09940 [Thermodesulfobacteriota bacterium]